MKMEPLIVALDLETSGVSTATDRPVQIGLVGEQAGVRRVLINTYVNPGMPIPSEARAIHGITNEMVQFAPDAGIAAWSVEVLLGALSPDFVIGYNSECYDAPMLGTCLGRELVFPAPHLDLLSIAYRFFPLLVSHKLSAVYQELVGWPLSGAHDAVSDATATLELLRAVQVKIGMTLGQLAEAMAVPAPYSLFPFGAHKGKLLQDVPSSYGRWALNNFTSIRPDLQMTLEAIAGGR